MIEKMLKGWRHENVEAIQATATVKLTAVPPAASWTLWNAGNRILTVEGTTLKGTGTIS
jgi:hypothetical protein